MDAALELVWSQSYGAVTIDDICKRAEVKKGSFYYYYDSKEQLAVAALERLWAEDWKPTMDGIFSASIEPLERLNKEIVAALKVKAVADKVLALGGEPAPMTPAEFDKFVRKEIALNAEIVKASGYKPQ